MPRIDAYMIIWTPKNNIVNQSKNADDLKEFLGDTLDIFHACHVG